MRGDSRPAQTAPKVWQNDTHTGKIKYAFASFQPIENAMDNLLASQNTSKKTTQVVRMEILHNSPGLNEFLKGDHSPQTSVDPSAASFKAELWRRDSSSTSVQRALRTAPLVALYLSEERRIAG